MAIAKNCAAAEYPFDRSKAAGRIPMCWWSAACGIQEANSKAADSQAGRGVAGDRCGWIAVSAVRAAASASSGGCELEGNRKLVLLAGLVAVDAAVEAGPDPAHDLGRLAADHR